VSELEKILARGGSISIAVEDERPSGLVGPDGRPVASSAPAEDDELELEAPPCPKCGDGSERHVVEALGGHWRELCACGHEFRRGRGLAPTGGV
jgi:hypothetical protein